ncbi:MAG TPA: hypothetical protein VGB91_16180 [Rhizomicrobium sp.]
MDRIPRGSDLTPSEMAALRGLISRGIGSKATVPKLCRERLLALGLMSAVMGLFMPTPAGRIVARMMQ